MQNIKQCIIVMLMFLSAAMSAQESVDLFSVPLSDPSATGKLIVSQISGSIDVQGYDGKEVIVKASFGQQNATSKSKNGLKRIDNSSMNISAEEKNNVIQIINGQHNRETNLSIMVPKNFALKLRTINNGDIKVTGVTGELEISNVNGAIIMQNVGGSASVDTTNGNVKVVFNSIAANANMAFSSFNGDVDITFPKTLKADVKAKSDMGDVFTDFELAVDKQKPLVNKDQSSGTYKVKIEQWLNGKINGGGPEMLFKTFNGDIIIRSK